MSAHGGPPDSTVRSGLQHCDSGSFIPCIISKSKIIGSDLLNSDRSRWVVAWGMVNDLPIFKDLWTGAKYRTRDFRAFPLPSGIAGIEKTMRRGYYGWLREQYSYGHGQSTGRLQTDGVPLKSVKK